MELEWEGYAGGAAGWGAAEAVGSGASSLFFAFPLAAIQASSNGWKVTLLM